VDEKEMQWKKETLGPLLKGNSQKWRKGLTAEQIDLVQKICSDTFVRHPYQKIKVNSPLLVRWKGLAFSGFSAVFGLLYPIRIKFLK